MATTSISNTALDFSRANLLVFDAQQQARTIVRDMARRMGFAGVRALGRFEELADTLAASDFELIILSADGRISDVCDLVRQIRHGEVGRNPFAVTILTSVSVTENEAGQMVNSGADTVIFKPFSADGLFQRVATLVRARKPFVATAQYVGPDRRDGERHVGDIPLIEVPNTLAGSVNKLSEDMQAAIAEAKKAVVTQQAGRLVVEMKLIIDGLVADAQSGELTAERCATAAAALAESLEAVSGDVRNGNYNHLEPLLAPAEQVASMLLQASENPEVANVLVGRLSSLVQKPTDKEAVSPA